MGVAFLFGIAGILLVFFLILLGVAFTGLILLIIGMIAGRIYKKKEIDKKYPKVLTLVGLFLFITPLIIIIQFILPSNKPMSEEIYEAQTVQVIEAFEKQDADSLKETFLTEKQTDALNEKIMEAFTYIEGDIVSYDQLENDNHGGGSNEKYIYDYYGGGYNHVRTNTGKQYTIYINSMIIWGKEKQSGVKSIVVEEETEETTEEKAKKKEENWVKIE